MKLLLHTTLVIIVIHTAIAAVIWDPEWEAFKAKYDKHYSSLWEEEYHHEIYTKNKQKIDAHKILFSQGIVPYNMAINQFGDLTNAEFNEMMNKLRYNPFASKKQFRRWSTDIDSEVPDSIDWREKGYVTEVKDQGNCGACYAFSATGSLEGQHFAKTGQLISLSEQQIIDCSIPYGNYGCQGGLIDYSFDYIINARGIQSETTYPYQCQMGICKYQANNTAATMNGYVDLPSGNEEHLKDSVGTIGPVSVAVDASHMSFQFYSGGIYYEPDCSDQFLDHGLLVVGYGNQNGSDYWTVKNSWGTTWGDEGYILMSRNRGNNCGIASLASYPTV